MTDPRPDQAKQAAQAKLILDDLAVTRHIYLSAIDEGFTEEQAMRIVLTMISACANP